AVRVRSARPERRTVIGGVGRAGRPTRHGGNRFEDSSRSDAPPHLGHDRSVVPQHPPPRVVAGLAAGLICALGATTACRRRAHKAAPSASGSAAASPIPHAPVPRHPDPPLRTQSIAPYP